MYSYLIHPQPQKKSKRMITKYKVWGWLSLFLHHWAGKNTLTFIFANSKHYHHE
jgi:hypothetical protein